MLTDDDLDRLERLEFGGTVKLVEEVRRLKGWLWAIESVSTWPDATSAEVHGYAVRALRGETVRDAFAEEVRDGE